MAEHGRPQDVIETKAAGWAEGSDSASLSEVPATNAVTTPPAAPNVPWLEPKPPRGPFIVDRADALFALIAFPLGFFFIRWVLLAWQGLGVSLFTIGYCGAVSFYLRQKGMRVSRSGLFWLVILLLTGASYSVWENVGLEPVRSLFLFGTAVYWVVCATGMPLLGATSDWLPLDGLNGLFVIPLRNFGSQFSSLASLQIKKSTAGKQVLSIGLGLILALIVLATVLPLLIKADSGAFSQLTSGIWAYFDELPNEIAELFWQVLLTIPVATYLFALVAGCAHRSGSGGYRPEAAQKAVSSLRILPATSIFTALAMICGVYLIFIGSQLPYFFSAFVGQRPEGWQLYSEYARNGFFELCSIAAINLAVLAAANLSGKITRQSSAALRVLNCLLALLTLLLIATAMSKMVLYIGAYGLSMKRLLPCVFMVFLAVVCSGVVLLQRRDFSIMRLAAGVGTVMLCALCLINPDGLIAGYNANRYLNGTLTNFDLEILHRAGPAGVDAALLVYDRTNDTELRAALDQYLLEQQLRIGNSSGRLTDTAQNMFIRQKLAKHTAGGTK